jgi:hypothetical protein
MYLKYPIRHLMKENIIKGIKVFGPDGRIIEYYYKSLE